MFSVLLFVGHVLPFVLLLFTTVVRPSENAFLFALFAAAVISNAEDRGRGALPATMGDGVFTSLGYSRFSWHSVVCVSRLLLGTPATWKGRYYLRT